MPDGVVHLFPHQRAEHGPVRAHPDHRRRRQRSQLPGRLHRADARREPAACRGRGAGGAQGRPDQVLDGPELVSRRRGRTRRDLQLRHQAGRLPWRKFLDLLDPGGSGLGDHLEIPELHPARRQLHRRVLLGGRDQQLPAGRHRHQDDPHRPQHQQQHPEQGHLRRQGAEHLPRPREGVPEGRGRAQLHPVRLAADRPRLRRPHVPAHGHRASARRGGA